MQAWSRFWRRVVARPVRQAWGLAASGATWSLVGLSVQASGGVRVHTTTQLSIRQGASPDVDLGAQLRQVGRARGRSRHRVGMALAEDQLVSGVLEFPARMPAEDWAAEVQLEVAQMLGKEPDDVHFDFQPEAHGGDGLVQRVHWVGCTQVQIAEFKNCARSAGWQLHSVEPAWQAAQRAAAALQGGLASLLTQPTQDWQFHLPQPPGSRVEGTQGTGPWMPDPALQQAMKSEAGARLVACGLALKAWW